MYIYLNIYIYIPGPPNNCIFFHFAYDHLVGRTAYMPKFRILSCTRAGRIMTQIFSNVFPICFQYFQYFSIFFNIFQYFAISFQYLFNIVKSCNFSMFFQYRSNIFQYSSSMPLVAKYCQILAYGQKKWLFLQIRQYSVK